MSGTLFAALPLWMVATSLVTALLIFAIGEARQRTRTVVNLAGALVKLVLIAVMLAAVRDGVRFEVRFALLPGLDFVLKADALTLLFATLSALLWLLTTVYAIGYLERGADRARFFGFFSLAVAATMGIAAAGNLFTFFLFYELLTLATWPLVVHRGTPAAIDGGNVYLRYTLAGSALFLAGLVGLQAIAPGRDFILGDHNLLPWADGQQALLRVVFVLLVTGIGVKAALVPLHGWLPQAMVAPAPVSALLHAVAVVKAGAFGLVRVVDDVFGAELVAQLGVGVWLAALASVTIVYGSLRALGQTDLKRLLAWSTVSQVSYIVLGVALGGPALVGGLVHLVHQGLMKITLFFCAGVWAERLGVHRIDELDGLGVRMPWVGIAFSAAALGMIGLPPLAGFVSKWYLGSGALALGQPWVVGVLVASTLLNAAYFLPLLNRLWLRPAPRQWPQPQAIGRAALLAMTVPPVLTALASLAAGVFAAAAWSPLGWVRLMVES